LVPAIRRLYRILLPKILNFASQKMHVLPKMQISCSSNVAAHLFRDFNELLDVDFESYFDTYIATDY